MPDSEVRVSLTLASGGGDRTYLMMIRQCRGYSRHQDDSLSPYGILNPYHDKEASVFHPLILGNRYHVDPMDLFLLADRLDTSLTA